MSLESLVGRAALHVQRTAFLVRRARADRKRLEREHRDAVDENDRARREGVKKRPPGTRNILFITVDQQRWDALGCNGGRIARTPNLDRLAGQGIRYVRPHVQNVVCMPSRATMMTGQHPRTHGVIANGIALPPNAPNVARHLRAPRGWSFA